MADRLHRLRQDLGRAGGRLYGGQTAGGLLLTQPQHGMLVLGPPRSGKTTGLAIPNTLAAPGPAVVTSTKPDILAATVAARAQVGRCWLLDPTGRAAAPPGVDTIRWSPVDGARTWDDSLVVARSMTRAARPGTRRGESAHWTERAEALLAPLLHAAWLQGAGIETALGWVLCHNSGPARATLEMEGVGLGVQVLTGIDATDPREQSGIWSSTAGVLAAYRSEQVLDHSGPVNFDPATLATGSDTVYVCAPARHQELMAPVVVAFLEQARAGAYAAHNSGRPPGAPLTFVLDELANIAPIPDLAALVSEGGSQGVLTIGFLQDLSQARARWGAEADGLLTLFGTKVVLPGIADLNTLELVSRLAGEYDAPTRSESRGPWWAAGRGAPTTTRSTRRLRRLPVDAINHLEPGAALVLSGAERPGRVSVAPWWAVSPFREAAIEPGIQGRRPTLSADHGISTN